jgi:hypothetical protein
MFNDNFTHMIFQILTAVNRSVWNGGGNACCRARYGIRCGLTLHGMYRNAPTDLYKQAIYATE